MTRADVLSLFTQLLAANGYQKLPSGLIIQWGQASPSSGTVTVTFPIAFPAACAAVTSSPILSGVAATTLHTSFTLTTSLTGCTIGVRTLGGGLSAPAASTAPVQYHAIGY